jgi:hypothetical protein
MFDKKTPPDEAEARAEAVRQAFAALRDQVCWSPNPTGAEVSAFYINVAKTISNYIKTGEE